MDVWLWGCTSFLLGRSPGPRIKKVSVKAKGCQIWRTESVFKKGNKKWKQYETILEFNKKKEIWKGYAMTDGAKEAIEGAAPMLSESQVLARLRETTEARDMIQRSGQPPLVSLSGIREWMRLAEIGGCLTAEQLEGMERALAAVDRMKRYLEQGKIHETALAWYGDDLQSCQDLREAIGQQIRGGQVSDHAAKALRAGRMDIEKEERSRREKAETAM